MKFPIKTIKKSHFGLTYIQCKSPQIRNHLLISRDSISHNEIQTLDLVQNFKIERMTKNNDTGLNFCPTSILVFQVNAYSESQFNKTLVYIIVKCS